MLEVKYFTLIKGGSKGKINLSESKTVMSTILKSYTQPYKFFL